MTSLGLSWEVQRKGNFTDGIETNAHKGEDKDKNKDRLIEKRIAGLKGFSRCALSKYSNAKLHEWYRPVDFDNAGLPHAARIRDKNVLSRWPTVH